MNRDDVRSDEELAFSMWLDEAISGGLVCGYEYEPETFMIHRHVYINRKEWMRTKTKVINGVPLFDNKTHGDGINYTPDFKITLTRKGILMFRNSVFWRSIQTSTNMVVWVDVKGGFGSHGGHTEFFLKQRMMWDAHGIYVQKVNPSVLMKRTWAPEKLRWMKNRRKPTLNKLGKKTCTLDDYFMKNRRLLESHMELFADD